MPNEADTCRRYVVPKLQAAGWEDELQRINEQVTFTGGRIMVPTVTGMGRRVGVAYFSDETVLSLGARSLSCEISIHWMS